MREEDEAVLVDFDAWGPTWIELTLLAPGPAPAHYKKQFPQADAKNRFSPPPDWTLLRHALRGQPIQPGRRRRPPLSGELVWIRGELPYDLEHAWRFLCQVRPPSGRGVVLLQPEIRADQALVPASKDVRFAPFPEGRETPEAILLPIFPLPDGTENPGWRPGPDVESKHGVPKNSVSHM